MDIIGSVVGIWKVMGNGSDVCCGVFEEVVVGVQTVNNRGTKQVRRLKLFG